MKIQEVLDHYFPNKDITYFHQSDHHANLEGDTYLKYVVYGGGVELYLGGNNGEVCVLYTKDGEKLNNMIKLLLYA